MCVAQQDCSSAYVFEDSIGDFEINNGFGKNLEISGYNIRNDKFFTAEHATAWVIVEFTKDGVFSFELIPDNKDEDFDFIIFDYYGKSTCDSIVSRNKLPIRSNLSRRKPESGSVTGLQQDALDLFMPAGVGKSFSKAISVNIGDKLLLVFDAPYGINDRFKIVNTSIFKEEKIRVEQYKEQNEIQTVVKDSPKKITFKIYDSQHNVISKPKAILKTVAKEYRTNLTFDSTGNIYSEHFKKFTKQRILITQPGFVQEEFIFKWTGASDTIIDISLVELKEGMKLQFENILFQTNSSNILKGSEEELENLSVFLLSNENLVVEIGGHIYSGSKRNKRKFVKLSKQRAKVVYGYLITAGVDKKNMKHKGYGNSRMLYKFPKSEREYRANRRVELTIISVL